MFPKVVISKFGCTYVPVDFFYKSDVDSLCLAVNGSWQGLLYQLEMGRPRWVHVNIYDGQSDRVSTSHSNGPKHRAKGCECGRVGQICNRDL